MGAAVIIEMFSPGSLWVRSNGDGDDGAREYGTREELEGERGGVV